MSGIDVKDTLFVEVTKGIRWEDNVLDELIIEAVLGLGVPLASRVGRRNIAQDMFEQGLVDGPRFELIMPRLPGEFGNGPGDEEGRLCFGSCDSFGGTEMITVTSLTNKAPIPGFRDDTEFLGWSLDTHKIVFGDLDKDGITIPTITPNTTSWIEIESFWTLLPGQMAPAINSYMGASRIGWSEYMAVSCGQRFTLPDIVLTFRDSESEKKTEVRISPFDYILEISMGGERNDKICLSTLERAKKGTVVLGIGFLRSVRTAFDVGDGSNRASVGCKSLSSRLLAMLILL